MMFLGKKTIVENNSIGFDNNKKKAKHQKYLYFISISIIIVVFFLSIINISNEIRLAIIAIVLGLIAVYITIKIAQTQDEQLTKLQVIGKETNAIASQLKINASIQERIKRFFPLKDTGKKYKLFFPVEYVKKPLPIVNQGDFYAIHVLSTRLGSDNLEMQPVEKSLNFNQIKLVGDAILMCAPHANPVLRKLYNFKEIMAEESKDNLKIEDWLKTLDLPCWFVEEKGKEYLFNWYEIPGNDNLRLLELLKQNFGIDWVETAKIEKSNDGNSIKVFNDEKYLLLRLNDEKTKVNLKIDANRKYELIVKTENGKLDIYVYGWTTRKIWCRDNIEPLQSDAEKYYQDAHKNNIIINKKGMEDYGIFARVNKEKNQYIIIAGIHQYGTWAIASLLSYLLTGKPVQYSKTFLSNKEFIAVIWGKFNESNLTFDIENIKVERNYIWTKEGNEWVLVPPAQE